MTPAPMPVGRCDVLLTTNGGSSRALSDSIVILIDRRRGKYGVPRRSIERVQAAIAGAIDLAAGSRIFVHRFGDHAGGTGKDRGLDRHRLP